MNVAKGFKLTPLNAAIGAALLSAFSQYSVAAVADEEAEKEAAAKDTIEVIEVRATSFADSLGKALSIKRSSAGSVDTILAEDIADFPDQNLAESLQRLPGVTITREAGEGRNITVRGLNPTFTRVTLNGMQAQSLAAGTGGVQTNRGFDFNVFASELFNQLSVHKTTSAQLEEGSLGATVELQTGRPFDFKENVLVTNWQGSYNDQSEELDPRFAGVGSWTNEDRTFGILVSASLTQRLINNVGADTGRWEDSTFGACSACNSEADVAAVSAAWHPRFPRFADRTDDQQRTGLTASIQFAPSDFTEITFDALYANIEAVRSEPFMQAISLARTGATGVRQSDVTDFRIDSRGTMVAATIDEVDVRSEHFQANWDSEFTQFTLAVDHEFTDNLKMNVLVGSSKSQLDNRETTIIFEHYSSNDNRKLIDYAENQSAVSFDFTNMLFPVLSYNFDTTNPLNWENSEFRDRIFDAQSKTDNVRIDLSYFVSDELTVWGGGTFREYSYDITGVRADRAFISADGQDGTADGSACGIGPAVTASDGSVASFGGQSFFLPDIGRRDQFVNSGCWPYQVLPNDTRGVVEQALTYYIQADFNKEIAGRTLRGNAGVRYVKTDIDSRGVVNGTDEVVVSHSYTDTLPAINLAYELSEDLLLRASWSKVMARPNLGSLNPGGNVTIFGVPSVRNGNPFLQPFRADATDISVEWYFDEGALLSLAYFRKDIESFPFTSPPQFLSWAETGLPESLLGAQRDDLIGETFEVTRVDNGSGGELDGIELQYQQPFTFIDGPEWVKKFGVLANVTFVDSDVAYNFDGTNRGQLTGQSDESANFTLYWEDDVFSARVSMAYRGEFFTEAADPNPARRRIIDATTNVDASLSYKLSDSWRFTLEAINLTDEDVSEFQDVDAMRVVTRQITGRQFFFGFSHRM